MPVRSGRDTPDSITSRTFWGGGELERGGGGREGRGGAWGAWGVAGGGVWCVGQGAGGRLARSRYCSSSCGAAAGGLSRDSKARKR